MSMTGETEPRDSELLLPWYATERLDAEDAAMVEADLAQDAELTRRLGLVREERDGAVEANQALGAPSRAARDALFARIDAEAARAAPVRTVLSRMSGWFSGLAPRTMALAGAAAAVVIVVQAGVLSTMLVGGGGHARFTTASFTSGAPTAGQVLLVGFAPTATAAQITTLLRDAHATLVGGPRPGGFFEVKVADRALPEAEVKAAIDRFRAQSGVVAFVANVSGTAKP